MLKINHSICSQYEEPFVNPFDRKFKDLKTLYRTELTENINLDKRK